MIERTSFDTPTLPRLATIIAELQSGVIVIPEFQRPSVWEPENRQRLMDSIVKGLPIGSLLVWRSATHDLNVYDRIADIQVPGLRADRDKHTYLIDGHQRISTLFGALVRPKTPRVGAMAREWPIYYVLGSEESPAFKLPPPRGEPPSHWLPLDILLDGRALYQFRNRLYDQGQDAQAEEAERVANVFKDYIIPMVPLVTEDLDLVTDAFVRINSEGKEMSEAHMLRALTYLKGESDTDKGFKQVRKALDPLGWRAVTDQTLVNSLKASLGLDVYRSTVRELNDHLARTRGTLARLETALVEAVTLLGEFGVAGWGALPYAYQLVTLGALAFRQPDSLGERREMLSRWFWRTTYTEHFTGQTGGQIRRDLDLLAETSASGDADIAIGGEVAPLRLLRKGTVRTKAFLLFLVGCAPEPQARRQRLALLAEGRRSFPVLFPELGFDPGNVVIADPMELRTLRDLVRGTTDSSDLVVEHALPEEALAFMPDDARFVERRREILLQRETDFIQSLGLRMGDAPAFALQPDDLDQDETPL